MTPAQVYLYGYQGLHGENPSYVEIKPHATEVWVGGATVAVLEAALLKEARKQQLWFTNFVTGLLSITMDSWWQTESRNSRKSAAFFLGVSNGSLCPMEFSLMEFSGSLVRPRSFHLDHGHQHVGIPKVSMNTFEHCERGYFRRSLRDDFFHLLGGSVLFTC